MSSDAPMAQPAWLDHVQTLRVEPGDTVVLRCRSRLSDQERESLVKAVRVAFPRNQSVVLDEDMQLGVMRPA